MSCDTEQRLSMEARVGREKQVWEGDVRLVVGCVPIKDNKILLVSSRKNTDWILPKGGWENDETKEQCAIREAWEEAGVIGKTGIFLGEYSKNKTRLSFYLMNVEKVAEDWPEMNIRRRQWVEFKDVSTLCHRKGMLEVIDSAIKAIGS